MTILDYADRFEEIAAELNTTRARILDLVAAMRKPPPPVEVGRPEGLITKLPWNAESPWPFRSRSVDDITIVTIHHSGTTPRDQTSITAWNAYHTKSKDWPHIGYHYAIGFVNRGDPLGLYQLNDLRTVSWHDGWNDRSVGVVLAGDLRTGRDGEPTDEQAELFGRLMAWLVPNLKNLQTVVGHKHRSQTACPGNIELWGQKLLDACAAYGIDLKDKWLQPVQRASIATRMMSIFSAQTGPPVSDYEDV